MITKRLEESAFMIFIALITPSVSDNALPLNFETVRLLNKTPPFEDEEVRIILLYLRKLYKIHISLHLRNNNNVYAGYIHQQNKKERVILIKCESCL